MKIMKVDLPQIRCQLHDHAKSNMTMMMHVIINGTVESCMAIYLGMAMEMPGRYGGCFEEGIWWVSGTGESCAAQERLSMVEG